MRWPGRSLRCVPGLKSDDYGRRLAAASPAHEPAVNAFFDEVDLARRLRDECRERSQRFGELFTRGAPAGELAQLAGFSQEIDPCDEFTFADEAAPSTGDSRLVEVSSAIGI